jgi:hypothetical protein
VRAGPAGGCARLPELDDLAARHRAPTCTTPARRSTSRRSSACHSSGRSPVAAANAGSVAYISESSMRDRVDLGAREGAHRPRRRLRVAAGVLRGVARHALPAHRGVERLAQRLRDPVARALGQPRRHAASSSVIVSSSRSGTPAERAHRVLQAIAQRGDRPRPHPDGVPLEVELDELGDRELGQRRGLAEQHRLDVLAVVLRAPRSWSGTGSCGGARRAGRSSAGPTARARACTPVRAVSAASTPPSSAGGCAAMCRRGPRSSPAASCPSRRSRGPPSPRDPPG